MIISYKGTEYSERNSINECPVDETMKVKSNLY